MPDLLDRLKTALADRYAIEREIGAGGMATVYLARDLKHDREVAVKVLRPELAAVVGAQRFLHEIQIAAKLNHPHILTLIDSGEADGFLYYVMPYVQGESLRDKLQREKQLSVEEALVITQDVASAMAYAHAQGVIHRDLKPGNILLHEGEAMVADFGLALALRAAGGERLTETGLSLGTPEYMSPEQASADHELTARSDVYSLGAVLYELLVGEPPHTGRNAQAIIAKLLTERPTSLCVLRDTVPEELDRIVMRAVAKTPADRFATAKEFAEALAVVEAAPRTPAAPVAVTAKPKRNLIGYAVIAILAMIGAVTVISRTVGPPEPMTAAENPRLAVLPFDNLGSSEDDYFADGITGEISSRMAEISGLRVISSQSANQYEGSDKTLQQIGEELGVEYVLMGTIRTDRLPDGSGQVRVTPELIRVADDAQIWTTRYTASLVPGEIFGVQEQIANQVAEALNVTLLEPERQRLAARPTDDLAAWEYYLRGKFYASRSSRLEDNLAAADMYERAVARDSAFAIAWVEFAGAYMGVYQGSGAAEHLTKARAAVDRAFDLEPNLPEVHRALAGLQYVQGQYEQAAEALSKLLRDRPNDATAWNVMGLAQRRLGRWEEATDALTRTVELNPAVAGWVSNLARTHLYMREYAEADRYYQQEQSLYPDLLSPYTNRAWLPIVGDGSVERAQQILHQAVQRFGLAPVLRDHVRLELRRMWFSLPDWGFRQDLEGFTVTELGADSVNYYLARAASEHAEADTVRAAAYYDSLRVVLESRAPLSAAQHGILGIAYAGLGRRDDAVQEARRGVQLRPVSSDALLGPLSLMYLARTYVLVGEYDQAIEVLDTLVTIPSPYSRALLRVNTLFDPLRDRPRFQALLEERN